jgi:hypothetical protein
MNPTGALAGFAKPSSVRLFSADIRAKTLAGFGADTLTEGG